MTTQQNTPIKVQYTVLKTVFISSEMDEWLKKNGMNFSRYVRDKIREDMEIKKE